jgi:hypothetical protein
MKVARSAFALLFISACSTHGMVAAPPDMAPNGAGQTLSVGIGPIPLAAGAETVQCQVIALGNTTDIDIVKIHTTLQPGSHHLIAYLSSATAAQSAPVTCHSFDGIMRGEQPIFIAESAESTMQLPQVAAYHLPAGQLLRLEAHYINTTTAAIQGKGTVEFTTGASGQNYQPVGLMFCGSVLSLSGSGLAPNTKTSLPVGFYAGGGGNVDMTKLNVFAFTSHEHHFGTDVKVWKGTAAQPTATQLYDNPSWDNPPLKSYPDSQLLTFGPGEGIAWQCSYDTTGATTNITFGEHAETNEMCFIWAYYYPSVGRFISQGDCWQ